MFWVWSFGFGVEGLFGIAQHHPQLFRTHLAQSRAGVRVEGVGCGASGVGCMVQAFGCRV
jgi:hypothetical protein